MITSPRHPRSWSSAASRWPVGITLVWLLLGAGGTYALYRKAATPCPAAAAPPFWPTQNSLSRDNHRWNLLVFAHPGCPCTRATFSELSRLAIRLEDRARIVVLIYDPETARPELDPTEFRESARRIPGATVLSDRDGALARRFGARTSGQILLYSPDGALCFSGGINASRGHEGPNLGRDAILKWINGEPDALKTTPVFGCLLSDDVELDDSRPGGPTTCPR